LDLRGTGVAVVAVNLVIPKLPLMESIINLNTLLATNLALLGGLFFYLLTKIRRYPNVTYLIVSLTPLIALALGSYLFANESNTSGGAQLIVLGIILTPIALVPVSHTIGRAKPQHRSVVWLVFYSSQIVFLFFALREIFTGGMIEWVTGILEQPIIIIEKTWRYYFINVIVSNILVLLCLDRTLQTANKSQQEKLKYIFVAFLGFAVYFGYLSVNIILSSYISQSSIQLGAFIILFGSAFLSYGFAKYPLWEVKISVSRHVIFGSLSATAALIYLFISGTILDILRLLQPEGVNALVPAAIFTLGALFLFVYLSPHVHSRFKSFITRNFFRHKYDYRDLWMKFSEKSSGSLNIRDLLPPIAEFVADAMFVQQVAFWLRSPTSEIYHLEYCHNALSADRAMSSPLRVDRARTKDSNSSVFRVPVDEDSAAGSGFPIDGISALRALGIQRIVLVEKGGEGLALMGIGAQSDQEKISAEDDQFLSSVSNQLSHLILTHKISEELLLAREWDSFNRFASFILHDLKNLATLQGMTLENAKNLSHNPNFVSDAFATFYQTTEKMINLIASLSVQRGQFSLKQQPVNILEVLANTFDDLKIDQRNGVRVLTAFPPKEKLPIITGDPELLQKAFTNLLLNAIQSLPRGEGAVEVTVSQASQGKITASIRDTGCGISPEQMESLFRPFQTTKEKGLGIGLCHTRSIIEVHGGQIRIESQVNAGTKVEVELPTL
jgi:putative PEP-CTERM system histidine kinase